jgi:hypothetical protein
MSDNWEYKLETTPNPYEGKGALQNFLDDLGSGGWEAVSMVLSPKGSFLHILLKRKISS